jgi:CHAT domain-containing protein
LPIFQAIQERKGEAIVMTNLGNAYLSLSQYDRAIGYYQQALLISRSVQHRNGEANALGSLGEAYRNLSQYEQAINYYQQALLISRSVKDRNGEAKSLGNLGLAYHSLSQHDRAISYYQQAVSLFQTIQDRNEEAQALNNWGRTLYETGRFAEAELQLYASITLWESIRADLSSDQNKMLIFERQTNSYRTLQQVLITQGKVEQALEVAERGRARAFVELLAAKQATTNQPPSVKPLTIAKIKQIAKEQNTILVQYSLVSNLEKERSIYIWVVSPTGDISFRKVDLKSLRHQQNITLAQLVEQSREVIGARGRSDVEVALSPERLKAQQEQQTRNLKQLHELLIQPIADLLPQDPTQRVIFMPQGELFLVPFPALLDANGKALIEQHTILTAPSIQVLELTRQQRDRLASHQSTPGTSLIVGNPTMPKVVTQLGETPVQLSNLPGAKREALEIAKLFNTQAITGQQATKATIAQQMPTARLIHFATHGLLDDTRGLGVPGAIALAPSGNGQLNDGLLTSDEILDMKLNAELVVLSACDTGRGRITGDGVIGLSRSLITAGVPSIIVSLWKVPDDSTAFLMTEFYKNLNTTSDKAQALRQAMLTTRQKYPEPLNWAAFTLIGEAE